ncbi:MAG: beta-galactosidase [Lachnospiraceae bacterium]|nr:beta-galactosidase [Lachnospiraceae bacterium]
MNSKQTFQWNEMTMGTCYYPEHWDKSMWKSDLERMLEAGISTIRIAEFAWSKFEPLEGEFTFAFFDEFLELCRKTGMKVIMGTPTATPPAWLTSKYPEVLNRRIDGTVMEHGGRRHYNYNAPIYQELCARIVTKLGEHYGQHPAIVGWQIDNEINCEVNVFYSAADTAAFRKFLQDTYGTLEELNQAWGTTFWNQTYTDWEQVFVPRHTPSGNVNPHLELDYYRFVSESAIRFCRLQTDILRRYVRKGVYITTNGMFGNLDNHKMEKECLDVYTYDSYPSFAYGLDSPSDGEGLGDRQWSRNLNEVRSICPHFGIMEQQSGANGWNNRMEGPAPRPGQLKLWSMQSLAHGADYISYFRWRTCTMGTEIYWHGILDYDSRDNRKLAEVKEFRALQKKLNPICGADYEAAFAVVKDYDNEWDCTVDAWHRRVSYASEQGIFEASELYHTPYDVVYLQKDSELSDLAKYPVLIYPHPSLIREEQTALLKAYTEQGGTLILGCRSGYKDENGQCVQIPQPGLLAELTGTDVPEWTFTSLAEPPVFGSFGEEKMEAPIFNDLMKAGTDVKVLATYDATFYAGTPMLTEHAYGRGKVLHLGTSFSRSNTRQLLQYLGILEPYADMVELPENVELSVRSKDGKQWLFLLNYTSTAQTVTIKKPMTCMDCGKTVEGTFTLEPYGAAVLEC